MHIIYESTLLQSLFHYNTTSARFHFLASESSFFQQKKTTDRLSDPFLNDYALGILPIAVRYSSTFDLILATFGP